MRVKVVQDESNREHVVRVSQHIPQHAPHITSNSAALLAASSRFDSMMVPCLNGCVHKIWRRLMTQSVRLALSFLR